MHIKHELKSEALIFTLIGELDQHTAHEVISYVNRQVSMNRSKSVEMDFGCVTFMDSSGLAVAINAKRAVERNGNRLVLSNVPVQAMKIFRAARLDKIITFI